MIKRAMISGLNAAGVDVADLRVSPPAVSRHVLKTQGFAAAVHVGSSHLDPEAVFIRIYEPPRDPAHAGPAEGDREELHAPGAAARRGRRRRLGLVPGARAGELRPGPARLARRGRRSASAASGSSSTTATRRRRSCCRSSSARSASRRSRRTASSPRSSADRETLAQAIGHTKRLVTAIGADLGAVFDQSGERLYLVDEQGHEVPVDQTLLLYVRLLAERGIERQGRVPDHGHEQGRRARRRRARDHPHAELAQRADAARRPSDGRRLRGSRRRRLRLPGVPARLRRGREPREAARAARADSAGRSRSSSPSCPRRR